VSARTGMLVAVDAPSPFGSTLLVTSPEALLAEREVADFVDAALGQRPEATLTRLSAAELSGSRLAEVTGGSLFADAAVVVVSDLPELPQELADTLLGMAADPGPDLALALVHPGGVKGKAVLDKLRKIATRVADRPALKAWELPQWLVMEARREGGRMDKETATVLVEAVGNDLHSLASAVRQLVDDSEEKVLTPVAVRRYFGGRAEVRSYEVAADALAGRTGLALEKLRWALSTGVGPPQVTAALAANLRELGKYLDARDSRLRDQQVAELIGVPVWKLKSLGPLAREWRPEGVARAIGAVATADAEVKGASSDPGFALEQAVLTIVGCRGR